MCNEFLISSTEKDINTLLVFYRYCSFRITDNLRVRKAFWQNPFQFYAFYIASYNKVDLFATFSRSDGAIFHP